MTEEIPNIEGMDAWEAVCVLEHFWKCRAADEVTPRRRAICEHAREFWSGQRSEMFAVPFDQAKLMHADHVRALRALSRESLPALDAVESAIGLPCDVIAMGHYPRGIPITMPVGKALATLYERGLWPWQPSRDPRKSPWIANETGFEPTVVDVVLVAALGVPELQRLYALWEQNRSELILPPLVAFAPLNRGPLSHPTAHPLLDAVLAARERPFSKHRIPLVREFALDGYATDLREGVLTICDARDRARPEPVCLGVARGPWSGRIRFDRGRVTRVR